MILKTIFWDFDGVILDSMAVRDWGFREIFKEFTPNQVEDLIIYHRANGGLSRYVKIRYFYEEILNRQITEAEVLKYAERFSVLMKQELTNPKNLILDAVNFIKQNHTSYNFHIVSGSDQNELRFLCVELNLSSYFLSIHGSPTPKKELVSDVLISNSYDHDNCCLIGDSINDYEAAKLNDIAFFGYNNPSLQKLNERYISSFTDFS
ncbi:HAD family hydrolase [Leeuwenhoekiella nanhaiensis]|uniref:phosphoglycolate phosphatase n=1 Tax=Leeuwenhoekiella nanhaiensis TaxID=1655491 RepID=A0A2G1VNE0_9FLAO|nr:HAD hydrolase-like protein [Leeuwenhoekiella nanhaiensis]PHQ28287.1 haloacid dehalogenase [Leeuwenhoekiella nanhaiensis]